MSTYINHFWSKEQPTAVSRAKQKGKKKRKKKGKKKESCEPE